MDLLANNYNSYIKSQLDFLKNKKSKEKLAAQPFITVSRETGALGLTISKELSTYLNKKNKSAHCPWTVFNRNIIKNITESHDIAGTVTPYLNPSIVANIQTNMDELFNPNSSQHPFVRNSSRTILHLANLGNSIIIGCAANVITANIPGGLHIRLISSFESRLEHIQEYYPMSEKEAKEYIFTEEGNRQTYLKKYFSKDIADPALYNLVINVEAFQPKEIVQLIGDIIRKRHNLK